MARQPVLRRGVVGTNPAVGGTVAGMVMLLVAFSALHPGTATAQSFPADEDLELMLRYLVEDGEATGIVLGVLEADGSKRVLSYGSAGPAARPLESRSVFEIGSISKVFTGTLLANMAARGEVALGDPVVGYLPPEVTIPSRSGREITLLDLATHSSGLPRLPDDFPTWSPNGEDPFADYTVPMMFGFLARHELRRDPGERVEYSNLGAGLLGHALSRAAGVPLPQLLRERIFGPLAMRTTGYELDGDIEEWMTKGHRDGRVVSYISASEAFQGSVGLRSNAEDLLTFLEANLGPPQTELEEAMRAAQEVRIEDQALGWRSFAPTGRPVLLHGGSTRGFSTSIALDPNEGRGIVVLTNSTGRGLGGNLALELLLYEPQSSLREVVVDPTDLARFAGEYELGPDRSLHIRLEAEGHLTFQQAGLVRTPLYAVSDTSFMQRRLGLSVAFQHDAAGQVLGAFLSGSLGDERTELTARRIGDESPPPAVVAGNAGFNVMFNRIQNRVLASVTRRGVAFWVLVGLVALLAAGILTRMRIRRSSATD